MLIFGSLIMTFQAIVLGVLQGVSELFPISTLGHTVLFPHLFGWNNIVAWQSSSAQSPRASRSASWDSPWSIRCGC
jgi:undecaprenyl pyrophosphate phosphatase UppP